MANQSVWDPTSDEQFQEFLRQRGLTPEQSVDPALEAEYRRQMATQQAQREAAMRSPELYDPEPGVLRGPAGRLLDPETEQGYAALRAQREGEEGLTTVMPEPAPEQRPGVGPLAFFSPEQQAPGAMPTMPAMPGTGRLERAIETIRGLPGKYTKEVGEAAEGVAQAGEQLKTARQLYAEKEAYLKDKQAATARTGLQAAVELDTEMRAKRQVAEQRVTTSLQAYEDELQKQMKEKPVEGWGLGKRLGAGIAMALGAIGSAYTGGPNQAMQIIKMGIEREAEEHRRRAALRREQLRAKNVIYQLARESFTDVESQISAAKIQQLNGVRQQLAVQTMESEGPLIRAKSAEMDKLLEYEIEKERAKLTENEVRNELVLGQAVVAGEQTLLGAKMAGAGMRQKAMLTKRKAAEQEAKLAIPGLVRIKGVIPSEAMRTKASEMKGNYDTLISHLDEAVAWRREHWVEKIPGAALEEGKAILGRALRASAGADMAGAALTAFEGELTGLMDEGKLADPGKFGFFLAKLKKLRDLAEKEAFTKLKPIGYIYPSMARKKRSRKIGETP